MHLNTSAFDKEYGKRLQCLFFYFPPITHDCNAHPRQAVVIVVSLQFIFLPGISSSEVTISSVCVRPVFVSLCFVCGHFVLAWIIQSIWYIQGSYKVSYGCLIGVSWLSKGVFQGFFMVFQGSSKGF